MYNIIVRQDNAKYKDEYEAEASSNQSFCEVSINIVYDTVPNVICPLLINAVLSKYQGAREDERTDSESALEDSSYCASGFMYRGYIDVYYSNGTIKRIPAQSGGWINKSESPFKAPEDKNNYNLFEWPDTACPTCLTTPADKDDPGINPEASGNTNGYTISIDEAASQAQIQGAGCGRTHIKLHLAKRIGSEGCISTIEWYDAGIQGAARTSYENNPLWFELVDVW